MLPYFWCQHCGEYTGSLSQIFTSLSNTRGRAGWVRDLFLACGPRMTVADGALGLAQQPVGALLEWLITRFFSLIPQERPWPTWIKKHFKIVARWQCAEIYASNKCFLLLRPVLSLNFCLYPVTHPRVFMTFSWHDKQSCQLLDKFFFLLQRRLPIKNCCLFMS